MADYPLLLPSPMAVNGNKNTIPTTAPTAFSYDQGFPAIFQIPPSAGGLAPDRSDINAAFYVLSWHIFYQQSGGKYNWIDTLNYPIHAQVVGSNGILYKCLQENGPGTSAGVRNPISESGYWANAESQDIPDGTLTQKGIVQLSNAINSTSDTLAATPSAVKAAYDLANGKFTARNATTSQTGIVQLNTAVNSTSTTQAATPSAVKQAYDRATTAFNRVYVSATDNANYIKFSNGIIMQWGTYTATTNGIKTIMFPVAFTDIPSVMATVNSDSFNTSTFVGSYLQNVNITKSSFQRNFNISGSVAPRICWTAIGK